MDINFHYFAVKALASKAGFAEDEAQTIASYSQFIDDFDSYAYMYLDEVPEFARYLAVKIPLGPYIFNPVTTGFNSWFDMAVLTLEKNQKWIVTPYHFIPRECIKNLPNRLDWRVNPARMDTPSLIRDMLKNAKDTFIRDGQMNRQVNLMRIGMLLHTFADTYAHQNFSGYWGWENHSYIEKVVNNIDDKDITDSYSPNIYWALPSIGHTNVNHAPDDSNVTFYMREKLSEKDDYSVHYGRSNTRDYVDASKEIMNFLLSCLGRPPIDDAAWGELTDSLAKGFMTSLKEVAPLAEHWKRFFPAVQFYYSKDKMLQSMLALRDNDSNGDLLETLHGQRISTSVFVVKSEMFFHYNVLADKIRTTVNGENFNDVVWEACKEDIETKGH